MANLVGNLWEFNLVKVVIVDVTDDYKLMQPPMPADFYPVIQETWLPRHNLAHQLSQDSLVNGYLYDWHEIADADVEAWYVGVVQEELVAGMVAKGEMGVA
jgi:hypothetical protein